MGVSGTISQLENRDTRVNTCVCVCVFTYDVSNVHTQHDGFAYSLKQHLVNLAGCRLVQPIACPFTFYAHIWQESR